MEYVIKFLLLAAIFVGGVATGSQYQTNKHALEANDYAALTEQCTDVIRGREEIINRLFKVSNQCVAHLERCHNEKGDTDATR